MPAANIILSPDSVVFPVTPKQGLNELDFVSIDEQDRTLGNNVTLWAGSHTLMVTVVDENNAPVTGASVTASLADGATVAVRTTTTNGIAVFCNMPDAIFLLESVASGDRYISIAVSGSAGKVQCQLCGSQ